jgi:hypothetical protein
MSKGIVRWMVASMMMVGILVSAYFVVRLNEAAMAGAANGSASGFYGH